MNSNSNLNQQQPIVVVTNSGNGNDGAPWWARWGAIAIILIVIAGAAILWFIYSESVDYCSSEYNLPIGLECYTNSIADLVKGTASAVLMLPLEVYLGALVPYSVSTQEMTMKKVTAILVTVLVIHYYSTP